MSAPVRVLGYDPGIGLSGFGVVDRIGSRLTLARDANGELMAGTITTRTEWSLTERLRFISEQLTAVVAQCQPIVVGIEDQLGVAAAARQNANRAVAAAKRGEQIQSVGYNSDNDGVLGAQFMAMGAAFAYRKQVQLVQPKSAKVALLGRGGGDADKGAMKAAVARIFPELQGLRFSSHAADGIAIALAALRMHEVDIRRVG